MPAPTSATLVKIAKKPQGQTLSKGQKLFNQLSKKITNLRKQVSQWQDLLPQYQQQYQEKFLPLIDEFNHQRLLLVRVFDSAYDSKFFSKKQRQQLAELIQTTVDTLLEYESNDELKALYGKYHGQNYDNQEQAMQADLQALFQNEFGIKIDQEIDYRDPEAVMKMLYEHAQAAKAEQEAAAQHPPPPSPDKARPNKHEAKQAQKREKQQAEQALAEEQLRGTLREVYRKLASALHPDRETDAAERERKTGLMSQVNVAYDNEDFLRLLELQLEIEQIDAATIGSLSAERQKHYNRVLQEQVQQLEMELAQMLTVFQMRFSLMQADTHRGTPNAAAQLPLLAQEMAQLQEGVVALQHDVQAFSEPKHLKNWLVQLGKEERAMVRRQTQHQQMLQAIFGQDEEHDDDYPRWGDKPF